MERKTRRPAEPERLMERPVTTGDREPKPFWQARRVCTQLTKTATTSLWQTMSLAWSLQHLDSCRATAWHTGRRVAHSEYGRNPNAGTISLNVTVLDSGNVGVR